MGQQVRDFLNKITGFSKNHFIFQIIIEATSFKLYTLHQSFFQFFYPFQKKNNLSGYQNKYLLET